MKIDKMVAILMSSMLLGACGDVSDATASRDAHANAIRRYDVIQSLAVNQTVVVAGTQNGAALVSDDWGKTWSRHELGQSSMIGLATCPDGSFVGIDFYHKVWSADAHGEGWKSVPLAEPEVPLTIVCDTKSNWLVGGAHATIARSSDRGQTWEVADLEEDAQITVLAMTDEQSGIALGEFGLVAKTVDGGATWTKGEPIGQDFYPYSAVFVNRNEGFASGIAGTILRTQDAGVTWSKIENLTQAPLYRLFLNEGALHGVGAAGVVAKFDGNSFKHMSYPDAASVFIAAGASIPGKAAIAIGGPGGLARVIDTNIN